MTSVADRSDRPLGGVELLDLASAKQREQEREREMTWYAGFFLRRPDRGYGGAYGQDRRWAVWECELCGRRLNGDMSHWGRKQAEAHQKQGHSPCAFCGKQLLNRKDGTPRQHSHSACPGKNKGFKIEREFVKNMTTREFA